MTASRLKDRVIATSATRGELALFKLDRATEITCVRCAGHSTTRWIAVADDNWSALWCKSCFLAAPAEANP
jgi:hypothetical protein